MSRILRISVFEKLATIPGKDKKLDRARQGINAAGKIARIAAQLGEV